MRNKSPLIIFIIAFVFMALMPALIEGTDTVSELGLNPYDYARITDVEYRAVVVDEPDSEGKVVITERLTFDIHAASRNNLFWELWRDLPEDYVDGVKVYYKVNSVKQICNNGSEIIYEESPRLYWEDEDYLSSNREYGPGKWYHSEGPYDESSRDYECVFFYVDGLYREEVVFEIEYEMYNAALKYNDCSDLYLALYSGDTIKHLESFKAEILFPNEDMPAPGNYNVYTYGTNSNDFPVTESATANPGYYTFSFELDEDELQFKPYNEYIEFDLVSHGKDKHIFTEYAPSNDYTYDDVLDEIYEEQQDYALAPKRFETAKKTVLIILSICSVLILVHAFTTRHRLRSKYVFYKPANKIKYFRDIPSDLDPNFAAFLIHCKHKSPKDDSGVYSAILLSLARKNYIELDECGHNDIQITLKNLFSPTPSQLDLLESFGMEESAKTYEPLTLCEEYYYNLLIRHAVGNTILMSSFQKRVSADYENTDTFAKNIKNSIVNIGIRDGYLQKANYNQAKRKAAGSSTLVLIAGILVVVLANIISYQTRLELAYGAFFIFGISCIINAIYRKINCVKYPLLTQLGEDEYAKWKGLYNFLNSNTLIHERTVIELPIWEKYLVYATAFGLSEKVIKAISIRCPEAAASPILSNNYYRSRRFYHSGHHFRSAVHSGSHFGGSGGGFGYGGGGRGGGGGGGGH